MWPMRPAGRSAPFLAHGNFDDEQYLSLLHDSWSDWSDSLAEPVISSAPFTDTVTFTDVLSGENTTALTDVVAFTDVLRGAAAFFEKLPADTIVFTDAIGWELVASSADTVTFADALAPPVWTAAPLTNTGTFTDAISGGATAILDDTLTLVDVLSGVATHFGTLADTATLTDLINYVRTITAGQGGVWVINADTGAVSTYTLPLTADSAAAHNGSVFIAAADGLYALDSTTDNGAAVEWTVQSGLTHFGTDLLKRVRDINVLGKTTGDLLVDVVTNRYGAKQKATYRTVSLTRINPRDGVTKVGQGLSSVYWGIGLRGTAAAEIDELRVNHVPLSRRR